jgi:hypothetical protein
MMKNYNFAMFIVLCIYNFSGLKILNYCEPLVKSNKVDSESKDNASNVYNENEHINLSKWNLIVCTIISIILLSTFNMNYNDCNSKEGNDKLTKCVFNNNTVTFFEKLMNESSFTRFLFAFNYSTLCLISPYWMSAFGIIIGLECKDEISRISDLSTLHKIRVIYNTVFNKIMVILTLSERITGIGDKKHNSFGWIYVFISICFCSIILLNYFMVNTYSNVIFWINLIVLIISLVLIITLIMIFNTSVVGICDILFGVKPGKGVPSVADMQQALNNISNE